jgi:hypothetical protein
VPVSQSDGAGLAGDLPCLPSRIFSTPGVQVSVSAVEGDCLADPHPGDGQQPDQGLAGRRAQRDAARRALSHLLMPARAGNAGPGGRPRCVRGWAGSYARNVGDERGRTPAMGTGGMMARISYVDPAP